MLTLTILSCYVGDHQPFADASAHAHTVASILEFNSLVVVLRGNPTNHGAIPLVSIPASGENCCVLLEGYIVGRAYLGTAIEALSNKTADRSSSATMGDIV